MKLLYLYVIITSFLQVIKKFKNTIRRLDKKSNYKYSIVYNLEVNSKDKNPILDLREFK